MLLLFGCSDKENSESTDEVSSYITKDGMYFIDEIKDDTRIVKYFDFAAKKAVPLCDKVNCKHEDDSCPAVKLTKQDGGNLISLKSYHKKLYLYYQSDEKDGSIMQTDEQGKNLKTIFTIPKSRIVNDFDIYHDQLFYCYNVMGYQDKEETVYGTSDNNVLAVYDLEEGTNTDITKSDQKKKGYCMMIGFDQDVAYFIDYRYDKKQRPVYAYHLDTKETERLDENNRIDMSMMYDGKLYGADAKTKEIYSYDFKNKTKTILTKFAPHKGTFSYFSRDGIVELIYLEHPNEDDAKRYIQVYDVKAKKFLFEDYRAGYEVTNRCTAGFIGTKDFNWGVYDSTMNFQQF